MPVKGQFIEGSVGFAISQSLKLAYRRLEEGVESPSSMTYRRLSKSMVGYQALLQTYSSHFGPGKSHELIPVHEKPQPIRLTPSKVMQGQSYIEHPSEFTGLPITTNSGNYEQVLPETSVNQLNLDSNFIFPSVELGGRSGSRRRKELNQIKNSVEHKNNLLMKMRSIEDHVLSLYAFPLDQAADLVNIGLKKENRVAIRTLRKWSGQLEKQGLLIFPESNPTKRRGVTTPMFTLRHILFMNVIAQIHADFQKESLSQNMLAYLESIIRSNKEYFGKFVGNKIES